MEGDSTRNSCILTILGDESLRKLTDELIAFFKDPNASTNTLLTLIKDHCPSSSVVDGIIALYSAAKLRPTLCKYLNQVVKVLKLHQQQQKAEFPLDAEITSDLLHHAVSKDYEYLFQLLIQAGVSPNALSKDQKTPLSIAVVCHQFNPMKRLEYVQRLLVNGADPMITDVKGDSSFKRLCGMESNYVLVYPYFRDYLLHQHSDQAQNEFNEGLCNALYNTCLPIVVDLLKHGAVLYPLQNRDQSMEFLENVRSTIFIERRSITRIDPFLRCLIEVFRHNLPCQDHSTFLEKLFELIYIPGVCFASNNTPGKQPSPNHMKKLLFLFIRFGYLTKMKARHIRKNLLLALLNTPIENPSVTAAMRKNLYDMWCEYFDEMDLKYYQNPTSLRLISIRQIRQSLTQTTQKTVDQLNIAQHLRTEIFPKMSSETH